LKQWAGYREFDDLMSAVADDDLMSAVADDDLVAAVADDDVTI
jgi:hypothetical protein